MVDQEIIKVVMNWWKEENEKRWVKRDGRMRGKRLQEGEWRDEILESEIGNLTRKGKMIGNLLRDR